jgi:hypothetical protein
VPINDRIPERARGPLAAYANSMREKFGSELLAIYVQGSIALGDFDPRTSDIDVLSVLTRSPSTADEARLRALHRELLRVVDASLLEGNVAGAVELGAGPETYSRPRESWCASAASRSSARRPRT